MIRFFIILPKHILSAITSLSRHLAMTISSISSVTVTLLLLALFFILGGNIESFTLNIEDELEIHVSLDSLVDDEQIQELENIIKEWEEVKEVTFSSSEDELNTLIESNGKVFERYRDKNPMPNAFIVEVDNADVIQSVSEKLNDLDGIEKAEYGGKSIQMMIEAFNFIHVGGIFFIIALLIITLFLIMNTIKMTIYTRRTEIAIMRSVGAENWYIRTPFVIEGLFIGIFGAIIPVLISYFGYSIIYEWLQGKFISSMFILQPSFPFIWIICGYLLLGGALVGMLGSFMVVSKYLRWHR